MKNRFKSILLVLAISGAFISCGDDGTDPVGGGETSTGVIKDAQKKSLYDKVWYPTSSSGGVQHEFLSDGVFRLGLALEGRWTWLNNSDTMDILDHSNSRYKYVIKSVSGSTFSYTTSIDDHETTFVMKDTE